MAKHISADKLRKLGARSIASDKSKETTPSPDIIDIADIKKMAELAVIKSETTEKTVQSLTDLINRQSVQIDTLIKSKSMNDDLPPIEGFKINHGTNGFADTVMLIRSKKTIN
jgi:hypothetical protein